MSSLEKVYVMKSRKVASLFYNIIIVGTGGTGSFLIPYIARIKALGSSSEELNKFSLTVIDGDTVEEKNCIRQQFFPVDIGKNKAQVIAERCCNVYGTDIGFFDRYIESKEALQKLMINEKGVTNIIIGCVDNNKTRQLIDKVFVSSRRCFWIDSGNETLGGQVVCGYNIKAKSRYFRDGNNDDFFKDNAEFNMPSVTEVFPDVLIDDNTKFNSEMSCAELAESSPQNIFINTMAGQFILLYFRKIISSGLLDSFCTTFSIDPINVSTRFNTTNSYNGVIRHFKEATSK